LRRVSDNVGLRRLRRLRYVADPCLVTEDRHEKNATRFRPHRRAAGTSGPYCSQGVYGPPISENGGQKDGGCVLRWLGAHLLVCVAWPRSRSHRRSGRPAGPLPCATPGNGARWGKRGGATVEPQGFVSRARHNGVPWSCWRVVPARTSFLQMHTVGRHCAPH